jgi:hypothetical protein
LNIGYLPSFSGVGAYFTLSTFPLPDHAKPLISIHPFSIDWGYEGKVMIDRASMSKLNILILPSLIASVYLDVSSRVMNGSFSGTSNSKL